MLTVILIILSNFFSIVGIKADNKTSNITSLNSCLTKEVSHKTDATDLIQESYLPLCRFNFGTKLAKPSGK